MFRVLSEDESKKVVRWKAPDLKGSIPVANTRQVATPVRLDGAVPVDNLSGATGGRRAGGLPDSGQANATRQTASIPMPNPSANMLQSSYDEGYARGFAEGNAALHQESVEHLQALIDSLGKPGLKVPDLVLEQELIGLSLEIARLVVQREVEVDPTALTAMVRAGMEQLPNAVQCEISVHLHPLDANVLRETTIAPEGVEFVDDASLKRGDCRIVSGASTVHGGVDNWLEVMGAELGLLPVAVDQD